MGRVEEEKVLYQGMKPQKPGAALLPERVRKAEGVRLYLQEWLYLWYKQDP